MNITRDAAFCMYFYEEYADDNAKKCKEQRQCRGMLQYLSKGTKCCFKTPKLLVILIHTEHTENPKN